MNLFERLAQTRLMRACPFLPVMVIALCWALYYCGKLIVIAWQTRNIAAALIAAGGILMVLLMVAIQWILLLVSLRELDRKDARDARGN